MPAISKNDPRYYVKQVPLPITIQKGIKIQARSDQVYNPMIPNRDDIRKENYKRRFKQMNEQGFHAANFKPYQEVGHPLHLDQKKLILHALGQWNETHEVASSSSSDSDEEDQNKGKQPQQQKTFTTTNFFVRRTRKDLNTLKKEDHHSKNLIRNVRLGQGLFYTLRREKEQKVQAERRELRKRREQQKNEWQPPKQESSSSDEETDDELGIDVDIKQYLDDPTDKETFMTEVNIDKQSVITDKVPPSPDISINVTGPETPAVPESMKASRVAFHGVENEDPSEYPKSVRSGKSGHTLGTSSRALSTKRGKSLPPRPYTPQHSNINSEMDYVLDKEALFRQLCALYWLLEAMNTDNPNTMGAISMCWNKREIGGIKGKDRKQEKDKVDNNWNRFITKQALKVPTIHHYDALRPWRSHTQTHHVTRYLSRLHTSRVNQGSGHVTPSSRSVSPAHSATSQHEEGDEPVPTTLLALPEDPVVTKPKLVQQTRRASYFFKAISKFRNSLSTKDSVANGKRGNRLSKSRRLTGFQSQYRHRNSSFSMSRAGTPTGSQQQLNESLTTTGAQTPYIRVDSVIPESGQRSVSQLDTGRDTEDDEDNIYTRGLFRFLDEYYDSLRKKEESESHDDRNSVAEVSSSHSARSDKKGGHYADSDYSRKSRLASTAITPPQQYNPDSDIPSYEDLSQQQITTILESIERSYIDPRLHKLANPTERRTEKTMRADYNVRPKSSPAVLEFKNSLPSAKKKSLPRELRQQFAEAYQNKALILHDTLEALERERYRKVQNKFVHLPTEHSSFHRAVRTMRHKTVKEEEYLRESQRKQSLYQQWFTDLDSNIPDHFKQDWYLDKILTKLEKYGLSQHRKDGANIMKQVEANKQSAYKFLMVLTSLRDWEICSPDITAAIEFCRERIVEMPVEEYEDWFHQQFPKVIRPQTAPPSMKREDRQKHEQESLKNKVSRPRVPLSAPPGGRKMIKS